MSAQQRPDWPLMRLPLVLGVCVILGCPSPVPDVPSTEHDATDDDLAYPYERKTVRMLSGRDGRHLLSSGRVLSAENAPCQNAVVTLAQTFAGSTRHYLVVRTDSKGHFRIRGNARASGGDIVWAVTERRQLGLSWNSNHPVTVRLLSGSTVLHVTSKECAPVPNAEVTAYQSGIDTTSELMPPNIREILTDTTDEEGVATYPSQLGDGDLGFRVRASGLPTTTRAGHGHNSTEVNLLVMHDATDAITKCAAAIAERAFPDRNEPGRVNIGYAPR